MATKEDPLTWWKDKQLKLPTLAKLTKAYLAVQATSAQSERIFSAAALLITVLRNSLDPKTVKDLLFINRNWEWYKNNGTIPEAEEE